MFRNPFSFEGRIRRLEYGLSFIIYIIVAAIIQVLLNSQGSEFLVILLIPGFWFLWAQGAKREHDLGNSGWWQIIPFRPFWLIFQNGQIGKNKYGENPKGNQSLNQSNHTTINIGNTSQFGYDGGHNSQNTSTQSSLPSQKLNDGRKKNDGYQKGDLYN